MAYNAALHNQFRQECVVIDKSKFRLLRSGHTWRTVDAI